MELIPLKLTPKETEVLVLTAKGMEAKQIAVKQGITIRTVKSYKKSIFRRLGAVNSAQAVAIGKERGLI